MNNLSSKQSGAAAIWFVFVAIAILGMGALGVEGARYITEKAHLGETMEATAIAVSESDDIRDDSKNNGDFTPEQKKSAEKIAQAWIRYLVPDSKSAKVTVSRSKEQTIKEKNGQCVKGFDGKCIKRTVHKYRIDSTTTHDSWMHMKGVPSFDKQQQIYNKATAARVRTDFEPVDVVFVSDFSGSMSSYNRIGNLKKAIKGVTQTIYDATQELKKKHPGEKINDSSFGFVPFSKRIVVEKDGKYYCSSMLLPPQRHSSTKPRLNQEFDRLIHSYQHDRDNWYRTHNYLSNEKRVSEQYRDWLRSGGWSEALKLDRNQWYSPYDNHIDYHRTANELQLGPDINLVTPIQMGSRWFDRANRRFCTTNSSRPAHYMIPRAELKQQKDINGFNGKINKMRVGGGTDMYQGLLAAPHQFHDAKNKNRFIFVLSDGEENNDSFKQLVNNGLCKTLRKDLGKNSQGEHVKFEMFVIGLKFKNNDQAYKDCFGKHIYEVRDLNKLKDVIMELLSTTTSYNVER